MFKNYLKVILATTALYVTGLLSGCDANLESQVKQNQKIERFQKTEIAYQEAKKEASGYSVNSNFVNLQGKANLNDLVETTYKNILYLQELEANNENTANRSILAASTSASAIAFEAKSIPDRIKLGLKILEAIVQGSTQLIDVEQSYIDKFAFQITVATLEMINPLSDTKAMFDSLDLAIKNVMSAPKQKATDYANMHIRIALDKLLHKYRFYKFNETKGVSAGINNKLDEIVLLITGVRLNPFATVAEIKDSIRQVAEAGEAAKSGKMPKDFIYFKNSGLTAKDVEEHFKKLDKNLSLGLSAGNKLKKLIKNFENMKLNTSLEGKNEKVSFDLNTLEGRIYILKKIGKAIALGNGPYANRVQVAHTRLGFATTIAIVDALNPLSTIETMTKSINSMNDALNFLKLAPELTDTDIASIHYKERMAVQLRAYRAYQFNRFKNKPYKQVDNFNYAILLATGVRLDPSASVKKVKETLANLKQLADQIEALPDMTSDQMRANFALKHHLLNKITKVFFANKSKLDKVKAKQIDKYVWNARGLHLNTNASVGEVNKTIKTLEKYYKEISSL